MRDTKVVKQTLWIINNLESEEILNCRVCRLIGNLCESSYHAKAFHKAGVVKALAALLLETKSTATNLMIVRATRYFIISIIFNILHPFFIIQITHLIKTHFSGTSGGTQKTAEKLS